MRDAVAIRGVVDADFAQWLPLWDGYNRFYGRSGATALPVAITRTTWSRFLDDAEPVHALVAESQGTLLGLAHYLFHRSTTRIEPTCYLQDLYVDDGARGLGIGASLIATAHARAQENGAARLYWQTHETNTVARALYDKLAQRTGFIVYAKGI
ncbi:MAG TPA: GNAT family N-acetyltransferase [Luteimonas sp.]|nr:GNAT family N-acetyltransferase [Luteimonas sp.]